MTEADMFSFLRILVVAATLRHYGVPNRSPGTALRCFTAEREVTVRRDMPVNGTDDRSRRTPNRPIRSDY